MFLTVHVTDWKSGLLDSVQLTSIIPTIEGDVTTIPAN